MTAETASPAEGLQLLAGTRVVSIEQYISAPYCTQILTEAGADVIKVERPVTGEPRRGYDPIRAIGDETVSGGFASYNRGKRSIALDLNDPEDRGRLRALISDADVLVSNLRPGALTRLGLDPCELRTRYPSLIICEISGFGVNGGPDAPLTAFDSVIQAMSGLTSMLGAHRTDSPLLAPMSTMDLLTGIWAALGIALALTQRARTGDGAHIDAAMLDAGVALLERPLVLHEFTGEVPTRGADAYSPVGTFRAADGRWLSIVIPTDDMWERCCHAIDRPDLHTDPRLTTVLQRAERMNDVILPALQQWASIRALTANEAAQLLREKGQPVGIVQSIADVRASEHLAHREMFVPLEYTDPDGTTHASSTLLPRLPLLFDGRRSHPGPVPSLDEFTDTAHTE